MGAKCQFEDIARAILAPTGGGAEPIECYAPQGWNPLDPLNGITKSDPPEVDSLKTVPQPALPQPWLPPTVVPKRTEPARVKIPAGLAPSLNPVKE